MQSPPPSRQISLLPTVSGTLKDALSFRAPAWAIKKINKSGLPPLNLTQQKFGLQSSPLEWNLSAISAKLKGKSKGRHKHTPKLNKTPDFQKIKIFPRSPPPTQRLFQPRWQELVEAGSGQHQAEGLIQLFHRGALVQATLLLCAAVCFNASHWMSTETKEWQVHKDTHNKCQPLLAE